MAAASIGLQALDYRPRFPAGYRPGIGIVGCGRVVRFGHLPAYRKYGLNVVGVYDVDPAAATRVRDEFGVERTFASLDELLERPEIEIVDIATFPEARAELVVAALAAGKHVLSQKPLAVDLASARELAAEAERRGLRLAVNMNGRWAPAWRVATLLVEQGAVGDVLAITHLYDQDFAFVPGAPYDAVRHFVLFDFSIHFVDIARCWLGERPIRAVRAVEYRTPDQPDEGREPWGAWVAIEGAAGENAFMRAVGSAHASRPALPFWIHGSDGIVRGSVEGGEFVELERDAEFVRYPLEGAWVPDGFAGAMGELVCAVAEEREPFNSASHTLRSLELTLAACRSAEEDGRPVGLDELR